MPKFDNSPESSMNVPDGYSYSPRSDKAFAKRQDRFLWLAGVAGIAIIGGGFGLLWWLAGGGSPAT